MGRIRDGRLEHGSRSMEYGDQLIWESKVIPGLVMTRRMLDYLHSHYSIVKTWQPLMLDLEKYLTIHPNKTPKDFKKFVLNCAKRHADDVLKGYRFPDGKVNLNKLAQRRETVDREPSVMKQARKDDISALREKLKNMEHDDPDYERTLNEMRKLEHSQPNAMSIGEVFAKLAGMAASPKSSPKAGEDIIETKGG